MNILLIAKGEDIFKLTLENESLHETTNDNGIIIVNFINRA
jgi:hypothetical protein